MIAIVKGKISPSSRRHPGRAPHSLASQCFSSPCQSQMVKEGEKIVGSNIIMLPYHQVIMCPPDGQSWQVCHASHGDGRVRTRKPHTADKSSHSP